MTASRFLSLVCAMTVTGACRAGGETMVITSFDRNGVVTWTNDVPGIVEYWVEWASTPEGPWHASWSGLGSIAPSNGVMSADVPMYYRVVGRTEGTSPGMVPIPAGPFQMGDACDVGSSDELPVHDVFVSAFLMGVSEVTNEQMRDVMQWAYDHGKIDATEATITNREGDRQELIDLSSSYSLLRFSGGSFFVKYGREDHPCVEVCWYGAQAYCNYRTDMEGLERCIDFSDWSCDFTKNGYRLPTEAEWEKAARGGLQGHHYPWPSLGGTCLEHCDGTRATGGGTTPVGFRNGRSGVGDMANGYGLYDMAGNVWEWCWDWYLHRWYSDPAADDPDTTGPAGPLDSRVLRGGSWYYLASNLRCANRYYSYPTNTLDAVGFRCARGL